MRPNLSLVELPSSRARSQPDEAAIFFRDRSISNREFAHLVRVGATTLAKHGIADGDVVAVMLANKPEMIIALFATWQLGAALTPINPTLTSSEAQYQIADSGAKIVIADEDIGIFAESDSVTVVPLDMFLGGEEDIGLLKSPLVTPSLALLIYTSGTTGRPKGVMIDHENISAMCDSLIEALAVTSSDRSLLVLPLFHANGLIAGTITPLLAGGSVVIAPSFDPKNFWNLVAKSQPTYFSAVPTMYAMLLSLAKVPTPSSTTLRFAICGAAPMPAPMIGEFEERFGVTVVEGYGLSESTVASTLNPLAGIRKPGTVGLALPSQHISIVNTNGDRLKPGEVGEVIIEGPTIMRGYWKRPDETAVTLRGGALHTGDLGFLDPDGYLVLVDRIKDMIIRGGENIYPKEIENALYLHPGVLEAAVIGKPDTRLGEVVVAYVALRPGFHLSEDDLLEHCSQYLARYKIPKAISIRDILPKNSVGKIIKGPLRAGVLDT